MAQRASAVFLGFLGLVTQRNVRRWIIRIALAMLLLPPFLQWIIAYLVGGDARLLPPQLLGASSLLIVTAHPDDECLFFAPSILGVLGHSHHARGSLLVLSTGNNYGIGETRKQELRGSCSALGIDTQRCVAIDHPELQDNPKLWWDGTVVQNIVKEYVNKWDVDAIITFDDGGVSGHINHKAVSAAVQKYASTDARAPDAFMVTTTSLIRKYTLLGDLPLTALPFTWSILKAIFFPTTTIKDQGSSEKVLVASTWHRYIMTRAAFKSHDSQYSWDRHLYMILSRYVWFNDLVKIPRTSSI